MRCLGHWLSPDGSVTVDSQNTIASMWKCFYANLNGGLRTSSKATKLRFLDACVRPLAAWKWARWPWQKTAATRLDQTQTHMIAILCPVQPRPREEPLEFFRRRSLLTGRIAAAAGRWSKSWAKAVVGWHGHYTRDHAGCKWAPAISAWHDREWLAERRLRHTGANKTTRTNTRATQSRVHVRWLDGLEAAKAVI